MAFRDGGRGGAGVAFPEWRGFDGNVGITFLEGVAFLEGQG